MPMQISISNAIGGGGGAQPGGSSFENLYSFTFDGNLDLINMGNVLNMANDGTDAFSISCWYKTTDAGSFQMLVSKQKNTTPFNGFNLSMRGDLQRFHFFLGTVASNARLSGRTGTIATIRDGNWHHVCLTYDGSQAIGGFTLYFDGAPQAITVEYNNTPTDVANTVDFNIGARDSTALFFDGNIDETSFFNTELSSSDVTSIYNFGVPNDIGSLNPVGWWRMGDKASFSTNWTLVDQGSGSNNGTSVSIPGPAAQPSTDVPT